MNIPENPSITYIASILFIIGLFLFVSGLNIVKIEKITISHGFKTWFIGLMLMLFGITVGIIDITNITLKEKIHSKQEINNDETNKTIKNISSQISPEDKSITYEELPSRWTQWKWDYKNGNFIAGLDKNTYRSEPNSLTIINDKNIEVDRNSSGICQEINIDKYLGKRVKYSAFIKMKDVEGAAHIHATSYIKNSEYIDSYKTITSEKNKPITKNWTSLSMVFDIPDKYQNNTISLCFSLDGSGQAWIDDIYWEIIDRTVPVTYKLPSSTID